MPARGFRHGTLSGYTIGKCRQDCCRRVHIKHQKMWKLRKQEGHVFLVDAQPLRDHVAALMEQGMPFRAICLAAGWSSRNALEQAMTRAKVRPATLARVLAVQPESDTRDTAYVSALGTQRRLQALAVMGWTSRAIAVRLGHRDHSAVLDIQGGRTTTIRLSTRKAISAVYDELWSVDGGSKRTVDIARKRGWLPPLAWDDDTIEDPGFHPGDVRRTQRAVDELDVEELKGMGLTRQQAAWRLGVNERTLTRVGWRNDDAA